MIYLWALAPVAALVLSLSWIVFISHRSDSPWTIRKGDAR